MVFQCYDSGDWHFIPPRTPKKVLEDYEVASMSGYLYSMEIKTGRGWEPLTVERAKEVVQDLQNYINKKELEQLQVKD